MAQETRLTRYREQTVEPFDKGRSVSGFRAYASKSYRSMLPMAAKGDFLPDDPIPLFLSGPAEETNRRFRFLLEQGQTGLSTAFDLPTLYGYDADHPFFAGEFGHCGVGVSSLADMELLFDGIPLDRVTTSMTINGPAAIVFGNVIPVRINSPLLLLADETVTAAPVRAAGIKRGQ